jgi:hypothetical protein
MLLVSEPTFATPSPSCSVPPVTFVPPVYVFAASSRSVPVPLAVSPPPPLRGLARVMLPPVVLKVAVVLFLSVIVTAVANEVDHGAVAPIVALPKLTYWFPKPPALMPPAPKLSVPPVTLIAQEPFMEPRFCVVPIESP